MRRAGGRSKRREGLSRGLAERSRRLDAENSNITPRAKAKQELMNVLSVQTRSETRTAVRGRW